MKKTTLALAILMALPAMAQKESTVQLNLSDAKQKINKEIYGQFAEHLGTCIYGGYFRKFSGFKVKKWAYTTSSC